MTRHHFASALFALAVALPASAASITPLPGSTPQHAAINQPFPNPIGVTVLDDAGSPRVGVPVRWSVPVDETGIVVEGACRTDLGRRSCIVPTDGQGISRLQGIYGTRAVFVTVEAATLDALGLRAVVELTVDPGSTTFGFATSGSGQSTPIGSTLAEPFAVRIVRADGSPVPGVTVFFRLSPDASRPTGTFALTPNELSEVSQAITDQNGYASAGPFTVRWGMGRGIVTASAFDTEARAVVEVPFEFFVTNPRGGDTLSFQDMWWGGPGQAGWGVSITQHGDKLFPILFAYEDAGKPTWRVITDGHWSNGVGALFAGESHTPRGAPWFDYDAARFTPGPASGMGLSFQGEERGLITVTPSLALVQKSLERFDFSRDDTTPLHGVGDMWWGGPEQSGWGVSIMERPGGLFSMWFTYDANGDATWFVMPDGAWTSSDTYEGRMYRTTGAPWFTGTYDASQFRAMEVGPYSLRFLGSNHAQLEFNVDGRSGILDLVRFDFD